MSNPITAVAIYPDKRIVKRTVDGLADLQGIVGGLIEPVGMADGSTMYVNEEFRFVFGPEDLNPIASDVAGLFGRRFDLMLTGILGPVVIVGPVNEEGWDTDVTTAAERAVWRVAREAKV